MNGFIAVDNGKHGASGGQGQDSGVEAGGDNIFRFCKGSGHRFDICPIVGKNSDPGVIRRKGHGGKKLFYGELIPFRFTERGEHQLKAVVQIAIQQPGQGRDIVLIIGGQAVFSLAAGGAVDDRDKQLLFHNRHFWHGIGKENVRGAAHRGNLMKFLIGVSVPETDILYIVENLCQLVPISF